MAKFNLDNYETVEDRLKKFWKDFPKGRIDSNVVHITDDGTCVTIRTEIFKDINDDKPVTTGIAQETKGQGGFANADAWMENCETSSIGRALANWNYQGSTKPRPSREEMSKVQVEKKPVKKPTQEEQSAMEKVVDEMVKEPAKNVGEQLNKILEGMIEDESTRNKIKTDVYYELVENKIADEDINKWTDSNMDTFLTRVEDMMNKDKPTVEEKSPIEDVFGDVKEINDIPSGKWEGEPPTENQLKTFNGCLARATDDGKTDLVKKAKDFLHSGKANKKNLFDWIDTDADPWTLVDGS
tara:strand:+ start:623 stop:1516 length:894 start_codon:yes stop_codon:yes gene_type:complete